MKFGDIYYKRKVTRSKYSTTWPIKGLAYETYLLTIVWYNISKPSALTEAL